MNSIPLPFFPSYGIRRICICNNLEKEKEIFALESFPRELEIKQNSSSWKRKLERFHEHKVKQIDFQFGTET